MRDILCNKLFIMVSGALIAGIIFISPVSARLTNGSSQSMLAPSLLSDGDINPGRGDAERGDVAKVWAERFLSKQGVNFAHDKILKPRITKAFDLGLAVVVYGHTADPAHRAHLNFFADAGTHTDRTLTQQAGSFMKNVLEDNDFVMSIAEKIARETPSKEGKGFYELVVSIYKAVKSGSVGVSELKNLLLNQTRFVILALGDQFLDPYLYSIGDIASEEHRVIVAHAGRFAYKGSENVPGGARSIYLTLSRIRGYETRGEEGIAAFRQLIAHELTDLACGHRDEKLGVLTTVNAEIDRDHKMNVVNVTHGDRHGARTADTRKVSIEKYTALSDLGTQEVFAIKGSSKVHQDVPKGSRKLNLLCAKADVGSVGGHGAPAPAMLEAVADVWAKAAEEGKILDFFITRVGDDISVTVTHINGKDNEMMHKLVWDAFLNATVVAKDMSLYGAGQDLLKDSFSGNVKGAGPGITELEFVERPSEPIIVLQADKCGPGVFNNAIAWIYANPNSAFVALKPEQANQVNFGIVDFEHNNKTGREAVLNPQTMNGMAFNQAISLVAGEQTRYSFTNLTMRGEDVAGVTASRLHNIAGEYTGKDDPMAVFRTQKDLPAEGLITAPFFRLYPVVGWMMGSYIGYFLPCALTEAKIGVNDGPPLIAAFGFNINNGRLVGFMDMFGANPAVRAVQHMVGMETAKLLSSTDLWTEGKGRAPAAETAYQRGISVIDTSIPWVETSSKPADDKKDQETAALATATIVDTAVLSQTPMLDGIMTDVDAKGKVWLDLPLTREGLLQMQVVLANEPAALTPLVWDGFPSVTGTADMDWEQSASSTKPIILDERTGFIFGERATFGQEIKKDGVINYEPGLGIILPKFAKSGVRVSVIAANESQRGLIAELNASLPAEQHIIVAGSLEEAKAVLSASGKTARYNYFRVNGDIEPGEDRSVTVYDVTGLARRIIEILGHEFDMATDEINRLQEAAVRFAQAA